MLSDATNPLPESTTILRKQPQMALSHCASSYVQEHEPRQSAPGGDRSAANATKRGENPQRSAAQRPERNNRRAFTRQTPERTRCFVVAGAGAGRGERGVQVPNNTDLSRDRRAGRQIHQLGAGKLTGSGLVWSARD